MEQLPSFIGMVMFCMLWAYVWEVQTCCESNACTPVSLYSEEDKNNTPKCWVFLATLTSWEQKCGWKKSRDWNWWWPSLCRLALDGKQKTNTQYTGQIQRNILYKSESENMLLAAVSRGHQQLPSPSFMEGEIHEMLRLWLKIPGSVSGKKKKKKEKQSDFLQWCR